MKTLALLFDQLVEQYPRLQEQIQSAEGTVAFSNTDFFSPDPFYFQLNHLTEKQTQFYQSVAELPEGEIHQVLIAAAKLIYSRHWCGENTYYDSFFSDESGAQSRCQLYVSPEKIKPIMIERLDQDQMARPIKYQRYDTYGYQEKYYTHEGQVTTIEIKNFDKTQQLVNEESQQVFFDNSLSEVKQIISLTHEGKVLYDSEHQKSDLNTLLEQYQQQLLDLITDSLHKAPPKEPKICCMLLEYTMQGPFPPTLALLQECEKQSVYDKEEHPLLWLNAPDAELFTEYNSVAVDFYTSDNGLPDQINAELQNLPFEEQKQLVFKFYEQLCKLLKRNRKLKASVKVTNDFFVTARDFEECNELEYLERLLPKDSLKQLLNEIDDYENRKRKAIDDDEDIRQVREVLAREGKKYESLKNGLKNIECENWYSHNVHYFLKPYYEQIQNNRLPKDLLSQLQPQRPPSENYYLYKIKDGQLLYLAHYRQNDLLQQWYFVHEQGYSAEYGYDGNDIEPEFQSFSYLHLQNQKPQLFCSLEHDEFTEIRYQLDQQNRVNHCIESRILFGDSFKIESSFRYRFDYDINGALARITQIDINGGETVSYCIDNSFMDEAIQLAVQLSTEILLRKLEREKNLPKAIVLETEAEFPFPPRIYFKSREEWQHEAVSEFYEDAYTSKVKFNLYAYIGYLSNESARYFSRDQSLGYINLAFEQLAQHLGQEIEKKFDINIPVMVKDKFQSMASIDEQLKGM